MAAYLLFFPAAKGRNPQKDPGHFAAAGLEALWHERWEFMTVIGQSPSGKPGVVYTPRGRAGYFPEQQTWEKRKGYWLGRWNDQALTPESVLRHEHHGGVPVKMADGREWLVPIAHQLPHGHFFDGRWERRVKEPFREYWERTLAYYEAWREAFAPGGDKQVSFEWSELADYACLALGFNYYLTPDLVSNGKLLDDAAIEAVQAAAMQQHLIAAVAAQKKTDSPTTPATSSSSSGQKG